jgi:hypothetical protein
MARLLVRFIFLTLTFFLCGFIQTAAISAKSTINFLDPSIVDKSLIATESPDAESVDLPASSHGHGKDLCLPLVERAEEQELESKSFKKKLDRINNTSALSCALLIDSLFAINNRLSSVKECNLCSTAFHKYLLFRNLRS